MNYDNLGNKINVTYTLIIKTCFVKMLHFYA